VEQLHNALDMRVPVNRIEA